MPTYKVDNFKIALYGMDHIPPHVHVITPDAEAVMEIETGDVVRGDVPRAVHRRAVEWISQNRETLLKTWNEWNPL